MGFLITSDLVPDQVIEQGTVPPLDADILRDSLFAGCITEEVIAWAQENIKSGNLSTDNMVILDERTAHDNTCLLVTARSRAQRHG
jgi:hypothetical protein